jgi:alanine racemase
MTNQTSKEPTSGRPTWAEINLDALAHNLRVVKERVGAGVNVMAVVKANAYGHGAVECAGRLEQEGANWFGVALPEEGIELRDAGITKPILCLAGFWDGQAALCIQQKLVPVVFRLDMIEVFDRAARDAGVVADVHLKIDTGMGRLGVRFDEVPQFVDALKGFKNIRVDGLMTHFAAADDSHCAPLTHNQEQRFAEVMTLLSEHSHNPTFRHLANSAAIYSEPEAWGNLVRPGGVLYGLWRDVLPEASSNPGFQPVMSLRSRIMLLKWVPPGETLGYGCTFEASRKTLVATVPVGYDDGYARGLSNRARVIVRDSYAPVVGRVSMDFTLVDVTDVEGVTLGDEVTLIGSRNNLAVSAEDLAKIAGTLSYEVTCGISERVPRVYVG